MASGSHLTNTLLHIWPDYRLLRAHVVRYVALFPPRVACFWLTLGDVVSVGVRRPIVLSWLTAICGKAAMILLVCYLGVIVWLERELTKRRIVV